jgi:hypothetical protein
MHGVLIIRDVLSFQGCVLIEGFHCNTCSMWYIPAMKLHVHVATLMGFTDTIIARAPRTARSRDTLKLHGAYIIYPSLVWLSTRIQIFRNKLRLIIRTIHSI